jgi:alkylation response protein AidB-like acyl-CoA dehydrogenase
MRDVMEGTAPGSALFDNPIYRHPLLAIFPIALTSVIYGATRGMYETWRQICRSKASLLGDQIASFTHVQIRMAEIEAEITAAHLFLRHMRESVRPSQEITLDVRIRNRRNHAYLAQLCARAAERIYQASSGGANYESNLLQRYWRDIHAMTAHVGVNLDAAGETFGRHELGLPRNPRDPYL